MTGRTTTIVTTIDPGLSSKEEDRRVGYYAPGRSGSGVLLARGAGVRPKRSDFPRRFGAVSGLSVVSCTVFARNAWKPRRFGRLPDPQAAASLAYGASDSVESFGEVPFGVAVVQHHLGMRLSLLQPRTVEVRGPDRAGYRFALRGGPLFARAPVVEQGPADRPQGHQDDDRCGPADRRDP